MGKKKKIWKKKRYSTCMIRYISASNIKTNQDNTKTHSRPYERESIAAVGESYSRMYGNDMCA